MQTAILSLLSISALAYLGFGVLLYSAQRSILYYPTPETVAFATDSMYVENDGESLKVLRLNPGHERAIIYFGGNAEQVAASAPAFAAIFADATVYLVNYRGYGGSSGSPSEQAFYSDALAIHDYLAPLHRHFAVIGRSLGAGVATYLASARDVDRLVLVTPFDSIENVATYHYPMYPVALLLKDKFRAIDYAAAVRASILVLSAEHDQVVPRQCTESLIETFGHGKVKAITLSGTDHISIGSSAAYARHLREFL